MEKIKSASVKGIFYPEDKESLISTINSYKKEALNYNTRAVISPHAGYIYSGELASRAICSLRKDIENIFIIAPAHKVYFKGISLLDAHFMETPLGKIEINKKINEEIIEKLGGNYFEQAFSEEHSIEVQIPFIQNNFSSVKVIPVLICDTAPDTIIELLDLFYKDTKNGFIISSDLSHFLEDKEARKLDAITAQKIETGDLSDFRKDMACNAVSIFSLSYFAKKNNFSLIRIDMYNSSKATLNTTRTVGYGAWALVEKTREEFIKENYSKELIEIAKKSIRKENIENYPHVLDTKGACFVTLNKNNNLRGCIGSIIAHRPLIEDLISNAKNSAYNDPRFNPVQENEFNELQISISILSNPIEINFKGEENLLEKITPYKDGIIIEDRGQRAVYLPIVWEQLPNKKDFLNSLKIKAGFSPDYFSNTFRAYRFYTTYIK